MVRCLLTDLVRGLSNKPLADGGRFTQDHILQQNLVIARSPCDAAIQGSHAQMLAFVALDCRAEAGSQ